MDLVSSSGTLFALKQQKARRQNFGEEIDTHVKVSQNGDHDNVVKLYYASGNSCKTGLIAMEYCNGISLSSLATWMNESQLRIVTRQILSGLVFLHSIGIIHRDIKPENIIVGRDGIVKIIDLGVAADFKSYAPDTPSGSLLYMAPEQIGCMEKPIQYGPAIDIWALGISLIELALGRLPNAELSKSSLISAVTRGDAPTLAKTSRLCKVHNHFSMDMHDFISTCTRKDPNLRPTAEEMTKHAWLLEPQNDAEMQSLRDLVDVSMNRESRTKHTSMLMKRVSGERQKRV